MKIDSHQHFWRYNLDKADYGWIDSRMEILKRDYLPADLQPLLAQAGIDGCVAVQARQTLTETEALLQMAAENDFIKGVVGWVDLRAADVETQLARFGQFPKFKGVRHIIHDEPDDLFMLQPEFLRGLGKLRSFNLTYDWLLFPKHLSTAIDVSQKYPEQRFVVDHLAKPPMRDKRVDPWEAHIREIATNPNVYCKVSGMVTETHWKQWQPEDFRPYLDIVFDCFGVDRLMFGSDWPVCTLSGSYAEVYNLAQSYVRQRSNGAMDKVFGDNATKFYHL